MAERNGQEPVNVWIPAPLKAAWKAHAESMGETLTDAIIAAMAHRMSYPPPRVERPAPQPKRRRGRPRDVPE